jgi:phosphoribosylformimino-5-aminoimidazole carboxamide ribotide isomerase
MDIIPAIDLKGGKCVRLRQGRDDATTEYSDDPLAVADHWVRQGARRLHMVNLDGAFGRSSGNLDILRQIAERVDVRIQYGGGLRSLDALEEVFSAGAGRAVIGTVAVEDPDLLRDAVRGFGEAKIIVALDAVGGRVATRGWQHMSGESVHDLARRVFDMGVREILYTDIDRDGMMTGPDLRTLDELAGIGLKVIASGGVGSIGDVMSILQLNQQLITGVIVGKALYEGKVDLKSLIASTQKRV